MWAAFIPYKRENGVAKQDHNLWNQADLYLNPQPAAY